MLHRECSDRAWYLETDPHFWKIVSRNLFQSLLLFLHFSFCRNSVAEGMINKPRSFHRNYRHCNNNVGAPERLGDGCDPPQSFSLIDVLSAIIGRIYRFLFYPNRKGGNFAWIEVVIFCFLPCTRRNIPLPFLKIFLAPPPLTSHF